jgi:hypothetical protein
MNKEIAILEQATEAILDKTGMQITFKPHGKASDGAYNIVFQNRDMLFFVECKRNVPVYQVDEVAKKEAQGHPIMVIAEQIAAPAREQLRKKGIAYLEANGNAFINNKHAVIFLDGNKPIKETKPVTNRAFTKTGLKAVFHLLNDPTAITRTYRQLAEETNVALGNVKYIMDGLEEAGFILPLNKRNVALKNKKALLERWIAGYRETLKPDLYQKTFHIAKKEKRDHWQDIDVKELNMQWGAEAAGELMTNYLKAKELTLYTPGFTAKQGNTIGLIPDKDGDVHLYEKFWYEPGEIHPTTPPLLVYADLLITDDPRCIETAKLIYDTHLKVQIEAD